MRPSSRRRRDISTARADSFSATWTRRTITCCRWGCPSDFFALYRVSDGNPEVLKQTVVPIDQGVWYSIKVVTDGDHMSCYANDKMEFDVTDSKIKQGRIGLWAHDDSQPLFDNVKLTLPPSTSSESGTGSSEVPTGAGAPLSAPPPIPAEPGTSGGAPPPMPH